MLGTTTGSYATLPVPNTIFSSWSTSLTDYVRIPTIYGGTTGKWVVGYAHPWTVLSPSVSIGAVSFSFSSYIWDEWEWENTFTIPIKSVVIPRHQERHKSTYQFLADWKICFLSES